MEDVKSIEVVFENCESFEIEAKYFGGVQFEDIRTSIARIACNAITKFQTAYSVVLEVFSEGNIDYAPFGNEEKQKMFDRITAHHDITQFIIHYDDDITETYFVDYDEDGDTSLGAPNKNQQTYLSALGNLYIVIEKDKNLFDFFDKNEIDSHDHVDFLKSMILD